MDVAVAAPAQGNEIGLGMNFRIAGPAHPLWYDMVPVQIPCCPTYFTVSHNYVIRYESLIKDYVSLYYNATALVCQV